MVAAAAIPDCIRNVRREIEDMSRPSEYVAYLTRLYVPSSDLSHWRLTTVMGKIHVLPERVANQIAAGEVVERPASVVKELLENALDAGSTRIRILVEAGGKKLIQITDNGCGMVRDDAMLAFERHATSKIKDLSLIHI